MYIEDYINFEVMFTDSYKYVAETGNKISVSVIDGRMKIYNTYLSFEIDINYSTIGSFRRILNSIKYSNIIEQLINKQLLLFL